MRPQDLIQAFSRTNRIFDDKKHFGHIITFQQPQAFKEAADNAPQALPNGGENEVPGPKLGRGEGNFLKAWAEFKGQVTDLKKKESPSRRPQRPNSVRSPKPIRSLTSTKPRSASTQSMIKRRFIAKRALATASSEAYLGLYQNILAEIKSRDPEVDSQDELDIHYELESVQVDEINYAYILMLIQSMIQQEENDEQTLSDKDIATVDSYIESLNRTNPSLAEIIQNLWTQVQEEPERYRGQSITGVLDQMIESIIDSHIVSFAKNWYIGADELRYYIQHYRKGAKKQAGESQLTKSQRYKDYKAEVADAPNPLSYKNKSKKPIPN